MFFGKSSYPLATRVEQSRYNHPEVFSLDTLNNQLSGLDFDQLVDYVASNNVSSLSSDKQKIVDCACTNAGATLENVRQVAAQKQNQPSRYQPGRFII